MKGVCIALVAVLLIVPESSQQTTKDRKCWTQWFDRDDPSASGDWETLIHLHMENPGKICGNPLKIEVQTTAGGLMTSTGDRIHKADIFTGFVCKNEDQKCGKCEDYRVRFQCPLSFCNKAPRCWTPWYNRDDPSGTEDRETLQELWKEYPGKICGNPLNIEVQTTAGDSMASTGDTIAQADTTNGFICKNKQQNDSKCEDYRVRFQCPKSFCDKAPRCWTQWFDRDDPSGDGDWETLKDLRKEYPGKICDNPIHIHVQTIDGGHMTLTKDKISKADASTGFICQNKDQKPGLKCKDYRVQFLCPLSFCQPGPKCWTQWFDRDDPSARGDWETLTELRKENPGKICKDPLNILVQTIAGGTMNSTGDTIHKADTSTGFICQNEDQGDGKCEDYRVQFQCPESFCRASPKCWTQWFDRDDPSASGDWETLTDLRKENPGKICKNPLNILVQTLAGDTKESTGDKISIADTSTGFVCKNDEQDDGKCEDYRVQFLCPESFCKPASNCWTQWFDRDDPSASGDWETLKDLRKENPGKICGKPLKIQVRTTAGGTMESTGDKISIADTSTGFVCKNEDQKEGKCEDYRVQFQCPESFCKPAPECWTQWFDRDDPSASGDWETLKDLRKENPGKICGKPLKIQVLTTAGGTMESTGDKISIADTSTGFVCKNKDQEKGNCEDYRVRFQCHKWFCEPAPKCWTQWFDRDNPSGTGDWETLEHLRKENPGKICVKPLKIQVQTTAGGLMTSTGDKISIADTSTGFVCKNKDQEKGNCEDYRVRFQCPKWFCNPAPKCWTQWFDRDNPSGTGDWETLEHLRKENPGKICGKPLKIQVRTTAGGFMASTGDKISIADTSTGFVCKNKDQKDGKCEDYRVRFKCPKWFCEAPKCWTPWFDRDNPSGTGDWETLTDLRKENPGKICGKPLKIQVRTTAGGLMTSTGDKISIADTSTGFVCKNKDQEKGNCEDYRVRFQCPKWFCEPAPKCWTPWFDRDNPSGTGDWETLKDLRKENPGKICGKPLKIQVRTTAGGLMTSTGDKISIADTSTGFVCKNKDQEKGNCEDYRVRFQCPKWFCEPAPKCWTPWFDRDNPSGTGDWETLKDLRKENPGKICGKPLKIQVQTTAGGLMTSTGDKISIADTSTGFVCKNKDQKKGNCEDYRVRFQCPKWFCNPAPKCWTPWFDRDNPSGTGDWETLTDLRKENPGKICGKPLKIQVRTTAGGLMTSTGDKISIADTSTGFVCKNKDQKKGNCEDYRVRFQCPKWFCESAPKCWTPWFDRDNPSGTGDWETLKDLRKENPGKICGKPLKIQVRTAAGGLMTSTGDKISIADTSTGFVCKNKDQKDGKCEDYRVRFKCPKWFCEAPKCWTPWFDRDNPSGTGDWETLEHLRKENPGKICGKPLKIQVRTTAGGLMTSTGDKISIADTSTGFVCKNKDQKKGNCEDYRVRFQCPKWFCNPGPKCWTPWFDRDNPSGTGDWETLKELWQDYPGKICNSPLDIEVQTISGDSMVSTNDKIALADTTTGFVCKNSQQKDGKCEDYRVRFQCPKSFCDEAPKCWTPWFDRDNPSGTGDWETLEHLRKENPGKICVKPLKIQVQTTAGGSMTSTGDKISIADVTTGFICMIKEQKDGKCEDYRVRFQCPHSFCATVPRCWTPWFDRDNPSGTGDWETLKHLHSENPGKICQNPLQIDVQTKFGGSMDSTGDVIAVADTKSGFICKNEDQKCGKCKDYRVRFQCSGKFCTQRVCWTKWYDRDNPSGSGDFEILSYLRMAYPKEICQVPLYIDVVTTDTNKPFSATGQKSSVFSPTKGFTCLNNQQKGGMCLDYKVRFGCPCDCEGTMQNTV